MKNASIIRTQCVNGLTVFYGVVLTEDNYGIFGIEATDTLPSRQIIVSSWEVAEKIANLLIEDFGGKND